MIDTVFKLLAMVLGFATKQQSKALEKENERITESKLDAKFGKPSDDSVYDGL